MDMIVGFSDAKSWWKIGSTAIELSEKRAFSHCYIRYSCPVTKIELVVQASHGCVNIVSFDRFKTANLVIEEYSFNINSLQFYNLLLYVNTTLGAPYSSMQLLLIAIKKLLHLEINIHNKNQAFICSELASKICEFIGVLPAIENQDYMTPSDLNTLIKNHLSI